MEKRFTLLENYLNIDMNNEGVKNIGNHKFIVKNDKGNSFIEIDSRSGNFLYKDEMTKYFRFPKIPTQTLVLGFIKMVDWTISFT